jgi:galactonate dehydratase
MKVTAVETIRPQVQSNLCFVRVHTDTGLTGLGESF